MLRMLPSCGSLSMPARFHQPLSQAPQFSEVSGNRVCPNDSHVISLNREDGDEPVGLGVNYFQTNPSIISDMVIFLDPYPDFMLFDLTFVNLLHRKC